MWLPPVARCVLVLVLRQWACYRPSPHTLNNFTFLNPSLHSACNNLFFVGFIFFFSKNTYRALMALDSQHSIGWMALGGNWPPRIHGEYCLVLFHFNCWNGCGYKLLHTKGWQIMMKDTRVLSCVASSRRRKEIIAAELITWNLLGLPFPPQPSPHWHHVPLLKHGSSSLWGSPLNNTQKLILLTTIFRMFKDVMPLL